jgi:hypothetical protein
MKLIWTKNKMPLSWLIRWGLDEPVSHFAIVFDGRIVFHSNLFGVHLKWFDTFKKSQEIVFSIDIKLPLEQEEQVYLDIIGTQDGQSYDYCAFFYFMWRGFLRKFFGIPMPLKSFANQKKAFLCTELAFAILNLLKLNEKDLDLSITSPFQLYLLCKRVNHDSTK